MGQQEGTVTVFTEEVLCKKTDFITVQRGVMGGGGGITLVFEQQHHKKIQTVHTYSVVQLAVIDHRRKRWLLVTERICPTQKPSCTLQINNATRDDRPHGKEIAEFDNNFWTTAPEKSPDPNSTWQ